MKAVRTTRLGNDIRLAELKEEGILLTDGHFDYDNGYHGSSYLTAHPKMHDPATLAATLALTLQFLAGSPEIYLMSLGLIFLNSLRMKWTGTEISYRRAILFPLAANVLVAGLAMAQILPTLELLLESRWREPMGYARSPLYSLHPLGLVNLFFLDKEVILEALKK